MPGMEKMSCCRPTVAACDNIGPQLEKANCGCSITKTTETNVNVIRSSESFRIDSKELLKSVAAIFSFNQIEVDTQFFNFASFALFQQPKFLDSQKIYVFVSSFLI
jgi:hypothetical protein